LKRRKSLFPLLLTAILLFTMQPIANSFWGTVQTDSIAAFSKSSDYMDEVVFSSEDFTSKLSKDAELSGIIIESLPDEAAGSLLLDGRALCEGEGVSVNGLDDLSFVPAVNDSLAVFTFCPVFADSQTVGDASSVTIAVGKGNNAPPVAQDITAETYKGVYIEVKLAAEDPENDAVVYKILDAPKLGTAEIEGDTLKYTPLEHKKGTDRFTYVAIDTMGNSSEPADISIQIRKNSAKMTYADMEGNSAHLAALKLSQLGVITGEKIGASYFFHPDEPVTRCEFIALATACAGMEAEDSAAVTSFADDNSIAAWAKPYVAAAQNANLIAGYPAEDGTTVLNGEQPITLAEAAVIIDHMMAATDVSDTESVLSGTVPAWAEKAAETLSATGILSPDAEGNVNPGENIKRSDACKMLYAALDHIV
jgi:hypothetical protein